MTGIIWRTFLRTRIRHFTRPRKPGVIHFSFYDGTMNVKAVSRMHIERGLREALQKEELELFYQPIIGVQDGEVRGFEALLRWFRENGVSSTAQ